MHTVDRIISSASNDPIKSALRDGRWSAALMLLLWASVRREAIVPPMSADVTIQPTPDTRMPVHVIASVKTATAQIHRTQFTVDHACVQCGRSLGRQERAYTRGLHEYFEKMGDCTRACVRMHMHA